MVTTQLFEITFNYEIRERREKGTLSYCLRTKAKGEKADPGGSPPLEKGAGGISFHTVVWLHLFAPFAYFVVPFSLKVFSLQSNLPE